jgi:regulator of sirC expression with transglutaminase-like and TPR domain
MGMYGTMSLQQLLAQSRADSLAEAALVLSGDVNPALDTQHYLQRLQFYAEAISERLAPRVPLGEVLFQLNDYLFNDRGFHADCSGRCSPESIFLDRVIDNRSGSPLSITLIYLTVGRWLGLPLVAMSFPGRILVRYTDADGDVVIDPGDGGMPLQETDLAMLFSSTYSLHRRPHYRLGRFLSTTDDKSLLVRMLRQLKQGYLQRGDAQSALWALEKILLLVPGMASSFRERGYLYELLDCSMAAAEDYSRYLELMPDANDADLLRKRLPQLLQHNITFH